jgi:hypothetical protein
MKIEFDGLKEKLNPKNVVRAVSAFFENKIKGLLLVILFALTGYGGFIWYRYVYNPKWSESRQQEYLKTKDRGVIINKTQLEDIISERENRKNNYQKSMDDLEDIFRLKD